VGCRRRRRCSPSPIRLRSSRIRSPGPSTSSPSHSRTPDIQGRSRRLDLPLVWTSLLVGAIPRQGKTFAARLAAAGLVLDPFTRLYVADFKAGKDWDAAGAVAHRFMSGDEPEHVLALVGWLVELVCEVQGRYRRMHELDNQTCPESKVTPEMSRDRVLGMPITAMFIDEVQVPLEDRTPVTVQDKRLPAGEYVGELLTWLAEKGPAAGIVLVLATQRPDSKTIPSGLRAVLGSRFALRVMDWRDSNIVLGEQMNTRGYDSSRLLASHKGVGILCPDGDTQAGADMLALPADPRPDPDRGRRLTARARLPHGRHPGCDRTCRGWRNRLLRSPPGRSPVTADDPGADGITVRLPAELPVLTRRSARIMLGILVELTVVEPLDRPAGGCPDDS
jgi:hypothetical protein